MKFICRDKSIEFTGDKHAVMGILNVTPDSFSDGGKNFDPSTAIANALEMVRDGVDIIDIGGESTRPGAEPISAQEEIRRIIPVIEGIRASSDVIISIDTFKAETAAAALEVGADIINDVTALRYDNDMAGVVAKYNAGVILMYNRRIDENTSNDVLADADAFLSKSIELAREAGITDEYIMTDPGIGFGTTREEDMKLISGFDSSFPYLMALSRKRVADYLLGGDTKAPDRDTICLGLNMAAISRGASAIRVHDVKTTVEVLKGFEAALRGE